MHGCSFQSSKWRIRNRDIFREGTTDLKDLSRDRLLRGVIIAYETNKQKTPKKSPKRKN